MDKISVRVISVRMLCYPRLMNKSLTQGRVAFRTVRTSDGTCSAWTRSSFGKP
jgi:hypothetical protein